MAGGRSGKTVRKRQGSSFAVGEPVNVPKVGKGKVVSSKGDIVTVLFPDSRKRIFLKSYVRPVDNSSRQGKKT
jgi:ATP-dependent DNA helicase RecQ